MYEIPELDRARASKIRTSDRERVFFSIYYQVNDDAFRKAARTWKTVVKRQERFQEGYDNFLEFEVKYESGFKSAWARILDVADQLNAVVWAGHLLTHSSKGSRDDGLEFKGDEKDNGTLTRREIVCLPRLPWADNSYLLLAGCNSGKDGTRGWSPGRTFADHQGVLTAGQDGYGYFSTNWNTYSMISDSDQYISLWAYRRGRNSWFGNRGRVPATIYKPSRQGMPVMQETIG